eukprot:EG_transcript_2996
MASPMPERYLCPITTEVMQDPVMDQHGHNFERAAIVEWLSRSAECPLGREELHAAALYPNLALKEEIAEWLDRRHPLSAPEAPAPTATSLPVAPLEDPETPPTQEPPPVPAAPWDKLALDQDQYDRLLATFLSFGAGSPALARPRMEALCRYMNFVGPLDCLGELFPDDATPSAPVPFEEFMAFVQKHPFDPLQEYGLTGPEYAAVLKKFQALDVGGQGEVSREAALTLAGDLRAAPGDSDAAAGLPDPVPLHALCQWAQRGRPTGDAEADAAVPAGLRVAMAKLDLQRLTLEREWKFPHSARPISSPGSSASPAAATVSSTGTAVAVPIIIRGSPRAQDRVASRSVVERSASPHGPGVARAPRSASPPRTLAAKPAAAGAPVPGTCAVPRLDTQRLAKEPGRQPMSSRSEGLVKKGSFITTPRSPATPALTAKSSFIGSARSMARGQSPSTPRSSSGRSGRESSGRRQSAEAPAKKGSFVRSPLYGGISKQASFTLGPRSPTSTSTTPTGPTPRSPDSPRGGLGRQVSFTDPPSAPLSAGQPDTCLLADLGLEELLSARPGAEVGPAMVAEGAPAELRSG